jgi:hypothetical protein
LKRDDEIKKSKGVGTKHAVEKRERERIEHTFRERKRTNRWKRTARVENGHSREGDVGNLCADRMEWHRKANLTPHRHLFRSDQSHICAGLY